MNQKFIPFLQIIFILFFVGPRCNAQLKYVKVGVNGLTCLACCRSVELGIKKLNQVSDVKMNLDNSEGIIYFIEGADINIESIARAVVKAGFSVRSLSAVFILNNLNVSNGYCYKEGNYKLQFVNITKITLNGQMELIFLGKQFQAKSDYNKIKPLLINACANLNEKMYFVTL